MIDGFSETGPLRDVLVRHARDAFASQATIDAQWRGLNFTEPPDFLRAVDEYDEFLSILASAGANIHLLPRADHLTLDCIYTRDASIVSPAGAILCSMGKAQRSEEPQDHEQGFVRMGRALAGRIRAPGLLEGGDLVWLDRTTV